MILYKISMAYLEALILKTLQKNPTHGYALLTTLRKEYKMSIGVSTLYPKLAKLEKEKLVTSTWYAGKKMRKVYTLTKKGENMLEEDTNELRLFVEPLLTVDKQW